MLAHGLHRCGGEADWGGCLGHCFVSFALGGAKLGVAKLAAAKLASWRHLARVGLELMIGNGMSPWNFGATSHAGVRLPNRCCFFLLVIFRNWS